MIVPAALWTLVEACAPRVAPRTMIALIAYESAVNPLAIDDNTGLRSYTPRSRALAEAIATRLLAAGHQIDVGYAQLDSLNFAGFGLDVHSAFDPCRNVAAGGTLLLSAYAAAVHRYGRRAASLAHALSAYNSGSQNGALRYARRVMATARAIRRRR